MAGEGVIKESEVGRESAPIEIAEGGGSFQHYDANSPRPRTILTSGSWKVKRLLSARFIGTWGQFTAGIVELEVELHTSSSLVIPATMKIVHNIIGPAGLDTGQTDGYTLTPVGSSFPIFKTAPPTGPVTAGLATEFVIKRKD
ncbi:hypothetical protein HY009_04360 [Candidatus Acetothermia bacterium]|nr:hypothetical protein [Candidatus Acetothermia bacterium]